MSDDNIVFPVTEELHVLNNGVSLVVKKVFLDKTKKFAIIGDPEFSSQICYWFTNQPKVKAKIINSIEIVNHEEKFKRNANSFCEVLENNIGRKVVIIKKRYERGAEFSEDIQGILKSVVSRKFCQVKVDSKNVLINLDYVDSVESVGEQALNLEVESIVNKKKMKVNYFTKENTFVYLTHVNRNLSITPNYRLFLDEAKGVGNMKLEIILSNNFTDLDPKMFHFHFGTPKFTETFSLINHQNSFVINRLSHLLKSTEKKKSICYKTEAVCSKMNSKTIIPIFENDIKFDRVYKCVLYDSRDSLVTKKIVRIKNENSFEWTNASCIISSSKKLFGGNTNIPHVKNSEIAEIELKEAKSVRVFYTRDIDKICQIKQKGKSIIGEVIVIGKVKITNLKDKDIVIIIKHSFPGKFISSSIKAESIEEKIVANDLNPKETTITFVLVVAKNSKKKKLTLKYTKWDSQESFGKKAKNYQLEKFFSTTEKNVDRPFQKKMALQVSNKNNAPILRKQSKQMNKSNQMKVSCDNIFENEDQALFDDFDDIDNDEDSSEEFLNEECYNKLIK